jgi:Domain of unknown function (DUF4439)
VETLQTALAGEHAAIFGYGAAGPRLTGAAERDARAGLSVHRQRRALLIDLIIDAGAEPVAAAASYTLPGRVTDAASARALLAMIETQVAAPYADLVLTAAAAERTVPAGWLADSATRRARWGGGVAALPGLG